MKTVSAKVFCNNQYSAFNSLSHGYACGVYLKSGPLVCVCEEVHRGEEEWQRRLPISGETSFCHAAHAYCEGRVFSSNVGRHCIGARGVGSN